MKYLLGLCNSHLINWFFKKLSTNSNVNGYEIDNLPMVLPDDATIADVEATVELLLAGINENNRTCDDIEKRLNEQILGIYGLDDAEKAVVEEQYG